MNEFEVTGPVTGQASTGPLCPTTIAERKAVVLVAGAPTRLPGTGIEIRWDIEDNAGLFKRRLPDRPALVCTVQYPPVLDGSALRRWREHLGVPLRRVAAVSGLSHGHLNKIERCEVGRPMTAEVLAAYRQAGVVLPGVAVGVCPVPTADDRVTSSSLLTRGGRWRTRNNRRRGR